METHVAEAVYPSERRGKVEPVSIPGCRRIARITQGTRVVSSGEKVSPAGRSFLGGGCGSKLLEGFSPFGELIVCAVVPKSVLV